MPGYGLVLHHRRAPFAFVTGIFQWPRSLLRDAAQVYLEMNRDLAKQGLCLLDGHGANFAQLDCCRPVWLDFGSIVPLETARAGLDAFRRFFTNPLTLLARSSAAGRIVRTLLREGGLDDRELSALSAPAERCARRLWQTFPAALARFRSALPAICAPSGSAHSRGSGPVAETFSSGPESRWTELPQGHSLPADYEDAGAGRAPSSSCCARNVHHRSSISRATRVLQLHGRAARRRGVRRGLR